MDFGLFVLLFMLGLIVIGILLLLKIKLGLKRGCLCVKCNVLQRANDMYYHCDACGYIGIAT